MFNGVLRKMFTVAPTVTVPEYDSFLVSGFQVHVQEDRAEVIEVFMHDPDGYLQPFDDEDENERLAFATPQIEMMLQMLGLPGINLTIDSDENSSQKPQHTTLVYLIDNDGDQLGIYHDCFRQVADIEAIARGWDKV